jgi:undecaprenyl diphosphate synthase
VTLPQHVAIIMDGNGRWARERGKSRHAGHRAGVRSVRDIVEAASVKGIAHLTLFAFSSENWARPRDEVSSLMKLFFDALQRELDELHRNKVRLTIIGDREQLQAGLVRRIDDAERLTEDNDGLRLNLAVAYGGRWDIVNACRRAAELALEDKLAPADIDASLLGNMMQLGKTPDPDLLIRTGGEQRISNFLLWNLAYAELYFTDKLWPDFGTEDLDAALAHFAGRQRRFGHTSEQVRAAP